MTMFSVDNSFTFCLGLVEKKNRPVAFFSLPETFGWQPVRAFQSKVKK